MEVKGAQDYKQYVFWYEAIGTGMLLYAINLQNGEFFGQFGISFMLFALLLIGGPITGAHYNPAVTLGIFISNGEWAIQSVLMSISSMVNIKFTDGLGGYTGNAGRTKLIKLSPNKTLVSCLCGSVFTTIKVKMVQQ